MIQCMCGGLIEAIGLTSGRTRWVCRACGRYEVFGPKNLRLGLEGETINLKGERDEEVDGCDSGGVVGH